MSPPLCPIIPEHIYGKVPDIKTTFPLNSDRRGRLGRVQAGGIQARRSHHAGAPDLDFFIKGIVRNSTAS